MRANRLRLVFFSLLLPAFLLLVLLALARGPAQVARAAPTLQRELFVAPAGSGSLGAAAQPCDLATDGNTLFLGSGTYTGSGGAVITLTHSITLYGGWDGGTATPPIHDPTGFPSTLDDENQRRVVYVSAGAPTLDRFTITRGSSHDSGGGIFVGFAGITLRHNRIFSNTSNADGGAIFVNAGTALIEDNQILSNTATWAGGLQTVNDTDLTLVRNEFRGNVASISGGGVYIACCGGSLARVERNLIVANAGGLRTGGLRVESTRAQVTNNILMDNQATLGTGIYFEGGASFPATGSLTHNTLVGGPAGGEGLAVVGYVTTTLVNNIIASYTTGITVTTPSASHLSADHNLFWNAPDPLTGTQALLADPALDGSYHLTAGDAGDLYVSAFDPSAAPPHGHDNNTIWKITPDGSRTLFARVEATELAFLPNGDLLVTGPVAGQSGVLRVAANGSVTPFASGFLSAVGLAFDLSGDLYVSDDWHNSITRISGFPQGTLQGTVKDAGMGQPIPAARLSIVSDYPLVVGGRVNADNGGAYQAAVAPRQYSATASAPGYESSAQTASVQAGATAPLTFELGPALRLYLPLVLRNG